jgi:hypothetical protein
MNQIITVIAIILIAILLKGETKEPIDRDGLVYYHMNCIDGDTTYTLYSVFGMKKNLHFEIADSLVSRYQANDMQDSMSITFSKGVVLGISRVNTYDKSTLVDFCAYEYNWSNGKKDLVKQRCEE